MELQKKIAGNDDIAVIQETLNVQPDELSVGEHMDVSEECACDKKDEDVLGEVILAKKKPSH